MRNSVALIARLRYRPVGNLFGRKRNGETAGENCGNLGGYRLVLLYPHTLPLVFMDVGLGVRDIDGNSHSD